jgi:hypothetical protein
VQDALHVRNNRVDIHFFLKRGDQPLDVRQHLFDIILNRRNFRIRRIDTAHHGRFFRQ